ncbi:hypothetical protein H9P43_006056 [Blastocladiella emersonii ATCC 22665]|nr:hypothetical protein H9P43_006056 [Blastocladiella emersonii ATCC 22665]
MYTLRRLAALARLPRCAAHALRPAAAAATRTRLVVRPLATATTKRARGPLHSLAHHRACVVSADAAGFHAAVAAVPWDAAETAAAVQGDVALTNFCAALRTVPAHSDDPRAEWDDGLVALLAGLARVPRVSDTLFQNRDALIGLCVGAARRRLGERAAPLLLPLIDPAWAPLTAIVATMRVCVQARRTDDVVALGKIKGVPPVITLCMRAEILSYAGDLAGVQRLNMEAVESGALEYHLADPNFNNALLRAAHAAGEIETLARLLETMAEDACDDGNVSPPPKYLLEWIPRAVTALADRLYLHEAEQVLALLGKLGRPVNSMCLSYIAKKYTANELPDAALALIQRYAAQADHWSPRVVNALIAALAAKDLPDAVLETYATFRGTNLCDAWTYEATVIALANAAVGSDDVSPQPDLILHAIDVCEDMVADGHTPDAITASTLRRAATRVGDPEVQAAVRGAVAHAGPPRVTGVAHTVPEAVAEFDRAVEPLLHAGSVSTALVHTIAIIDTHGAESLPLSRWCAIVTALHRHMDKADPQTLDLLGQIHSAVVFRVGLGRDAKASATYITGLITAVSHVVSAQSRAESNTVVVVALLRRWLFGNTDVPACPPWVHDAEPWHAFDGITAESGRNAFMLILWTHQSLAVAADSVGYAGDRALLGRLVAGIRAGGPLKLNPRIITNANVWTSLAEAAIRLEDGELALACISEFREKAGAQPDLKMVRTVHTMVEVHKPELAWVLRDPRYAAVKRQVEAAAGTSVEATI